MRITLIINANTSCLLSRNGNPLTRRSDDAAAIEGCAGAPTRDQYWTHWLFTLSGRPANPVGTVRPVSRKPPRSTGHGSIRCTRSTVAFHRSNGRMDRCRSARLHDQQPLDDGANNSMRTGLPGQGHPPAVISDLFAHSHVRLYPEAVKANERSKPGAATVVRTQDLLPIGTPRPTRPRLTTAMAGLLARGSPPCAAFPDTRTGPQWL